MNCKYCGKKITKNSRFCPNCGGRVEEVKEAVIVEDTKEEKKEEPKIDNKTTNSVKNKTNGILVSAIIVTILSLLTFSIVGLTFSIIALVFAIMYKTENNEEQSYRKKYNSKIFGIISWVLFGINILIKIICGLVFASLISLIVTTFNESDIDFDKIHNLINDFYEDHIEDNIYIDGNIKNPYIDININNNEYPYITEIKYEKFKTLYKKETPSVVVLTQSTCPHCIVYKPIMNEIAHAYNIDIYYLDVSKMSEVAKASMKSEIDFFVGNEVWGTPTTLIVGNSITVDSLVGYADYQGLKDFLVKNNIINS